VSADHHIGPAKSAEAILGARSSARSSGRGGRDIPPGCPGGSIATSSAARPMPSSWIRAPLDSSRITIPNVNSHITILSTVGDERVTEFHGEIARSNTAALVGQPFVINPEVGWTGGVTVFSMWDFVVCHVDMSSTSVRHPPASRNSTGQIAALC